MMGEGVSGIGILTEERCDVLVITFSVDGEMKCMEGDRKQVFSGVVVVAKRLRKPRKDLAGAEALE